MREEAIRKLRRGREVARADRTRVLVMVQSIQGRPFGQREGEGVSDQILLFSYGTLQQPEVQQATFGRLIPGEPDEVVGYRLGTVSITDPEVIRTSGSDEHPVLIRAESSDATVPGTVFTLSKEQLTAADDYEVDAYKRVQVPLRSGRQAWVYVFDDASASPSSATAAVLAPR